MFKYLRAFFRSLAGILSRKRDNLMANENVMRATFDAAIQKNQERYQVAHGAITELAVVEQELIVEVKKYKGEIERFTNIRNAAQIKMQKRIDFLRSSGKTKEEIQTDLEFLEHQTVFRDVTTSLEKSTAMCLEKEELLIRRQKELNSYKKKLVEMQRAAKDLEYEKQETLADVMLAKQSEALNAQLAGLSWESIDEDLADVRKVRQRSKARANIVNELSEDDSKKAELDYESYAKDEHVKNELDSLLNWGDDPISNQESLPPSKLPE